MYNDNYLTNITGSIFCILVLSLLFHLLFSRYGFNPTDDGFNLAMSRRLLSGEFPHKDFISIRPTGTAILHIPEVLFGGKYTFLLSRLTVWIEWCSIAWIWALLVQFSTRNSIRYIQTTLLALIAIMFSTHTSPIMTWHTIDGLFLSSLGIYICTIPLSRYRYMGYCLIGVAALCKQNFILILPITLFLFGDIRKILPWLFGASSLIVYACFLWFAHGLSDAIYQISSQHGLLGTGIKTYLLNPALPWGIMVGYFGKSAIAGDIYFPFPPTAAASRFLKFAGISLILFALLVAGIFLRADMYIYAKYPSFLLFGIAFGIFVHSFARSNLNDSVVQLGLLSLLLSWSASISLGYNTPAFGTGILAVFIFSSAFTALTHNLDLRIRSRFSCITLLVLFFAIMPNYIHGRFNHIYRDNSADQLIYSLSDVFPGGNGIFTNKTTHDFLLDLNHTISKFQGRNCIVVPDLAGYWVKASQNNPLPIDWPQSIELNKPELFDRVKETLCKSRAIILVQKCDASSLAIDITPLSESFVPIAFYIKNTFKKIDETAFFEIYE